MDSVAFGLKAVAQGIAAMVAADGGWMTWNLLLAILPASLAIALFRPGSRRTPLWWLGVAVFVLFLPNAPYVLSDSVHLLDQIEVTTSDTQLFGAVLPVYTGFFLVGFGCYVVALRQLRAWFRHEVGRGSGLGAHRWAPDLRWWTVAAALHALCALGVFLGRVFRLNSWNALSDPVSVIDSLRAMAQTMPLVLIATFSGLLVVLTTISNVLIDAAVARARALHRALTRPPDGG